MRSSKSRSRSKPNRPRTLGNIINRVFDSSGPEGKVRGTPQQIIEKYQFLARDAQLSNDRVAAENFQQHAEHYTRLLAEAALQERFDLKIEEDLIEEVARVVGYDKLPTTPPVAPVTARSAPEAQRSAHAVRRSLVAAGYQETISYSFVEARWEQELAGNADPIRVLNPIAAPLAVMRSSLIGSLVQVLKTNLTRKAGRLRMFEIGRVYAWPEGHLDPNHFPAGTRAVDVQLPVERTHAGVLLYAGTRGHADPRAVTGAVAHVLARLGHRLHLSQGTGARGYLHPGVQVQLAIPGAHEPDRLAGLDIAVGFVGELHPELIAAWGLPDGARVVYGELDLEALPDPAVAVAREIPRFPATSRDLSLEIPVALPAAEVVAALRDAARARSHSEASEVEDPARLQESGAGEGGVEVLEDYRGAGVPDAHRALLLRLLQKLRP